jgi:lipopolysaccharide transport system ATP-binding protein
MSTVIKFENISKQYRLGLVSTQTLSHDLNRWWKTAIRGQEDPYLKIGEVNDRSTKAESEYVWALKDINFEVQQGDVLGIIGKNGSGKSTLLKILSKITAPTTGTISHAGRIAALLEVGTGFHPEMTGRENIYLNGAILGMTKSEIKGKLDEIIDFSGIERYIDTPSKRYSSGMYVRLGFAIAAHLDPEIMIVDEVLAVGDAEFQKKAIGKMQDVSKGEGRTVLFVSHNMASIKALCTKGIVLSNGSLAFLGNIQETVDFYIGDNYRETPRLYYDDLSVAPGNENIKIKLFEVKPIKGKELNVESGLNFNLLFYNYRVNIMMDATFQLATMDDIVIFSVGKILSPNKESKIGLYQVEFNIPPFLLNAAKYKIKVWFGENQRHVLWESLSLFFDVENTLTGQGYQTEKPVGVLKLDVDFNSAFLD